MVGLLPRHQGSSNTHYFSFMFSTFFLGHSPETSSFRLAKQILVVSLASYARDHILIDCNILCPEGRENAPRTFLV